MYQLTKEQKLENYKELLESKKRKISNLNQEISQIQNKIERLQSINPGSASKKTETLTDLDLLPPSARRELERSSL